MILQKKRKKCIVCKYQLSDDKVIIGDQYPSAIYPKSKSYKRQISPSSLNLAKCLNVRCGLVQLSNEYDLSYVLENYPYESGTTATMNAILQDIAKEAEHLVTLTKDDVILDIGGNDGSLLNLIKGQVKYKVNIDAAVGVKSMINAENYIKINGLFDSKKYLNLKLTPPKIIFSVAMFYHLNDPLTFCRNIRKIMSDETIWCLQMTYLGSMLEENIYDNIVHEHVAYYSLKSLEFLLKKTGLHICDAKIVKSYGGSLRVYISKKKKLLRKKLDCKGIKKLEENNKTNTFDSLNEFNTRIQVLKKVTKEIIEHLVQKNGKITALGASTKGNMICQFSDLNHNHIKYVLDNNPKKIGLLTTGSEIPITDEKKYLNPMPPYLLLLPYYYKDFFIALIKRNLKKDQSTYLIVPLPSLQIIQVKG